jgi:Haem-NO-binding
MYGLINKAVEGLIRSKFGDEVWHRIRSRAGVPDEPFITSQPYDDAVTYGLVAAASEETGIPVDDLCEAYGRYWNSVYTEEAGYGPLLHGAGRTLPELLRNLNHLHTRVKISYSQLNPPGFTVTDETPRSLNLHYYSDRPGIAPLLTGLLKGLGDHFSLVIDVTRTRVETPAPHDVFHLTWKPREQAPSS